MSIWLNAATVEQINKGSKNTMTEHLGIEITEIGADFITAKMPVDHRTVQPMRLLHGGASVVLAETLGSIAGSLCVDMKEKAVVGLEINANHLRGAREGEVVFGKVKPRHLGRTTQVWDIEIKNEKEKLVCVSRLTLAVIENKKAD
ncbi:MAG: hotdog fold thioesterase [Chitinophagales bacterium]